jgi:transposase
LSVWLPPGNVNDVTELEALLTRIASPASVRDGRALVQIVWWLTRATARGRTGGCCGVVGSPIPSPNATTSAPTGGVAAGAGGRPCSFDRTVYRCRNTIERCFNKLKQWRGIATRYDKTATYYRGAIQLCTLLIWLDTP